MVFLAHESTTHQRRDLLGRVPTAPPRVFLAECPGVVGDGTPEGFAGRVDELLSIEGWEIPSDMMDEVRYSSDHLGPDVAGRVRARRGPPRAR